MSDALAARVKRYTALLYAAAASLLLLRVILVAFANGPDIGHIVGGLVLVSLTIGLVVDKPLALKITGALCLFFALFLPISVFNPLSVGDYLAEGKEPPSFPGSLIWLIPLEMFLLFSAHVLDARFAAARQDSR